MFLGNFEVSYHKFLPYINLRNKINTQWTLQMVNFMNVNNYIDINVHLILSMITNYRLFKDKVLPSDNVLPGSYKEAKKLLKMLGVEYISYHACPNDCILYRGEYEDKEIFLKCGHEKYRNSKIMEIGRAHV